ncbi:EamA family transporter RarD [Curtobacterium ammoniigenes]|uniref:EamA family transporter RarD n=1 Tax=Curtobacterium ammoniigenes TaxID=395387 RepID=UPI000835169A|nr:EamA family transporter RarD [Curtobacterium ammoniigenes]
MSSFRNTSALGSRSRPERSETSVGIGQAIGAYGLWGALPLLFAAMAPAGPFEIVAWRIVFALGFCIVVIGAGRTWPRIRAILVRPDVLRTLGLAAFLIVINWTVYVSATTSGRTVEAALGYFINPLVTIALGVIVLRERLRPAQWVAVALSAVAVIVIAVGYGQPPIIALTLAFSFGLYGLVKKRVGAAVDALSGLTIETAWLVPFAVAALVVFGVTGFDGGVTFGALGVWHALLLVLGGPVTAVPLLLFASSARRLPLSLIGLCQYLTPVLQFIVGVWLQHEAMSPARWFGFAIVWLALVVLTVDAFRASRTSAGASRSAAAPAPVD